MPDGRDAFVIRGWRRLALREWGDPDGAPVFFLHGTPGGRFSARVATAELLELGVRLITYDRPGYGLSDPHPGRQVGDAAEDVRAIADHLRIEQFAVLGRSGGGPHALACAALLPRRVTRVASLVGLAPHDAPGLDWLQGMVPMNREHYAAAQRGLPALHTLLYPQVVAMRSNPEHLVRQLEAEAPADDVAHLQDPVLRSELVQSLTDSVDRTLAGWAADCIAFTRPWGFDPSWIRTPTLLWHATRDAFSPVSHARWLAGRIRGALLLLAESSSHLSATAVQREVIGWLLGGQAPALAAG